jgi:hypothetical protein
MYIMVVGWLGGRPLAALIALNLATCTSMTSSGWLVTNIWPMPSSTACSIEAGVLNAHFMSLNSLPRCGAIGRTVIGGTL